jgi:hypothetical protein
MEPWAEPQVDVDIAAKMTAKMENSGIIFFTTIPLSS